MVQIISGVIDGKPVDVVDINLIYTHRSSYPENYTAVDRGDEYIYPLRSKSDTRPGVYISGGFIFFKEPFTDKEKAIYSRSNVIDFSDKKTVSEIIQAQNILYNKERSILTTADNIFKPPISEEDQPEMVLMKKAVSMKNCDIDKYSTRFDGNFNNEKRLFNENHMSLLKIKRIAEALDMKVTMTIEDANPDVPNPMGGSITVQITSGGGTSD